MPITTSPSMVTIEMQTADRTRVASATLPRDMQVSEVIRTAARRWSLSQSLNYQLANLSLGKQLLPRDRLTRENVRDGDTLMLQPMPTHG